MSVLSFSGDVNAAFLIATLRSPNDERPVRHFPIQVLAESSRPRRHFCSKLLGQLKKIKSPIISNILDLSGG